MQALDERREDAGRRLPVRVRGSALSFALASLGTLALANGAHGDDAGAFLGVGYRSGFLENELRTRTASGESVTSRITWPGDGLLLSLGAQHSWRWPGWPQLRLRLHGSTNLTNPAGGMQDRDWLVREDNTRVAFTDSEVEGRMWSGELQLGIALLEAPAVELLVSYRHEYRSATAFGASGYSELGFNAERTPVAVDSDTRVHSANTSVALPSVGASFALARSPQWELPLEARVYGAVVSYRDRHWLRNKVGSAAVMGLGIGAATRPTWVLGTTGDLPWSIGADLGIVYWNAFRGTLKQRFENDSLTRVPDGDFRISALIGHVTAFLAVGVP